MPESATRYFSSYSGVKLPLKLLGAIEPDGLANRNTYIKACYDNAGQLVQFEKLVYGDVELTHRYEYRADGTLARAAIAIPDEDTVLVEFDEEGIVRS